MNDNEYEGQATQRERVDVGGNVPEEMPSLAEFAQEPGGAWPKGWYGAEIVEGYATGNGKTWTTEDNPSNQGDSRNLRICLTMNGGKLGSRNTWYSFNYRPTDFSADRLEAVREARKMFEGTKGAWTGHTDLQRSSLAIAKLGQFEEALGFRLKLHPSGHILFTPFIGQKVDIRLGEDDRGYNEVNAFAKAGTRAKGGK